MYSQISKELSQNRLFVAPPGLKSGAPWRHETASEPPMASQKRAGRLDASEGPTRGRSASSRAPRRRRRRGFTLIELVASISVGVIVSGLASSLIWNASKQLTDASARSEMIDEGAAAFELMFRYIREIPQNECPAMPTPCLLGNAQIAAASATELRFGGTGFRLASGSDAVEMTSDSGTTWHPLVKNVSSLAFSYYDRQDNALTAFPLSPTNRAAVRRIQVELLLSRGNESARLRSGVYLRSFMNEVTRAP